MASLWPGDLAVFLWHLYGATVQFDDMQSFRTQTRTLLGEYTPHFTRMRLVDMARTSSNSPCMAVCTRTQHLAQLLHKHW